MLKFWTGQVAYVPGQEKKMMEKKYYKPVSDTQYQRATSCLVPSTYQSGSQIKVKLGSRFKVDRM